MIYISILDRTLELGRFSASSKSKVSLSLLNTIFLDHFHQVLIIIIKYFYRVTYKP